MRSKLICSAWTFSSISTVSASAIRERSTTEFQKLLPVMPKSLRARRSAPAKPMRVLPHASFILPCTITNGIATGLVTPRIVRGPFTRKPSAVRSIRSLWKKIVGKESALKKLGPTRSWSRMSTPVSMLFARIRTLTLERVTSRSTYMIVPPKSLNRPCTFVSPMNRIANPISE